METKLGVTRARKRFSEIVEKVQYQGDTYVISRHGRPAAAIVPIRVYEKWKEQRRQLVDLIGDVRAANPDADPDEVMQDVLEAQQAVRAQESDAD